MRLTVGPLPPAVYWRRRAIVLSGVLLALFLLAQACMSASASPENRSSSEPSASPSTATSPTVEPTAPPTTAASSTSPTSQPATTPPDPNACTDDEMQITAEAAQTEFAGGTRVRFTIRIRNGAERTCSRDIGGDLRELYLRAGEGATKVWSSRDCGAPSGTDVKELTPGFATEYWVDWSGQASDSCEGDKPDGEQVPPGEYELIARLGTAYSEPVPITVVPAG